MNKYEAVALAKEHAALETEHSYTKVSGFEPHAWVVAAILEANLIGRAEGWTLATGE